MTINILLYTKDFSETWNEFIKRSKNGTFMLNRNFMDYHSDRFIDNSLMFYDDTDLIALLPASLHGKELRSHGGLTYGGFIVNEKMKQHKMNDCFNELLKYLKNNNINKLIYKAIPYIYHQSPAQEDLYSLFINNAKLIQRDVSTTIDFNKTIKMPKGRKAQISRAKREGVIIEESIDFENFIKLENEVLKKHHNTKAVHSAEELQLLKSKFNNNIHLYIAKYNNDLIAGAVIFEYENMVHTQYLASNDKGREIGALDLLIASLVDKYKENKRFFDFGKSTEGNGRYLNKGLISQKEGFGGRAVIYDYYEIEIH